MSRRALLALRATFAAPFQLVAAVSGVGGAVFGFEV